MAVNLGDKLQLIRKNMGYSQKDFATFLGIPQPSLSAYENDKNSPTTEVLINIATKCNISLDWLCGLREQNNEYEIHELKDIVSILYQLMDLNEVGVEIEVHDRLFNDIETETDRWYTQLTIYGNDKQHPYNGRLCSAIAAIRDSEFDVESYSIGRETYDTMKAQKIDSASGYPLTRREIPELTREERMKKRNEWMIANPFK